MSTVTIEVVRESLHFSVAHFTIFSATERENLHGHNFRLNASFECELGEDGLAFDYGIIKSILQNLCDGLDEHFLIPVNSPHLKHEHQGENVKLTFNNEQMTLPRRDVLELPVRNITVEEMANWFKNQLTKHETFESLNILRMQIWVASGQGQWGVINWERT